MPALLCRKCGFNNPPGMRFCGNCGSRLGSTGVLGTGPLTGGPNLAALPEQVGVMMGADLLERFRQAGLEAAGQRRTVTLLFADLSGFTGLSQRLDTEELFVLVQQFANRMAQCVYKYEGMVDKFIGDGLMAIFGAPIAQENNAEMAIRAALDMQQEISVFSQEVQERYQSEELSLHVGLHSGIVIVGSMGSSLMMNYTAIGDTVNLAARIEQNADPGEVWVSQTVYQNTRPLFDFEPLPPLQVKGYTDSITAYRLIGPRITPGSVRGVEGLSAPLIGRETEISYLRAAADQLVAQRQGRFIFLEGEAGIGKSRLTAELRAYLRSQLAHVLVGYSYTYRRMMPYWIFQDLLRGLFGLQQNSPEPLALSTIKDRVNRLSGIEASETLPFLYILLAIGLDRPEVVERMRYLEAAQLRQRIFLAVRQVLVAEARSNPLVLIFEDLHWADETSLDLLDFLVDSVLEAPLVYMCLSRNFNEESLERLLQKAERYLGKQCLHLSLAQLNPLESQKLLAELLAVPKLPPNLHDQILSRSAGNPLYLEEILRMLIDEEKIHYVGGHWQPATGILAESLGVPDTLQGLILARFDRMEPTQRRVLQIASVIGRNFSSRVLRDVLRQEEFEEVPLQAYFDELEQRGFILPQAGLSDFDYYFKHVLVSDAIYSALLKSERSELHGQVGEAIERLYPERLDEMVELLARHYAWSARSDRALHYLLLAGKKEARNYANQQARQSFEQALDLLARIDHDPGQEIEAHIGLADVLVFTGNYPNAVQHYQNALDLLATLDRDQTAHQRSSLLAKLSTAYERQGSYDQALAMLSEAQAARQEETDPSPIEEASILNASGWIFLRRGNLDLAEDTLKHGLALVENSDEFEMIASIVNRLGGVAYQKGQLDQASKYVQRSLEIRKQIGDVNAVARSNNNLGLLNWRRGAWNSALENFKRSIELHGSLGDVEGTIEINSNLGLVYLEQGDFNNAYTSFSQALLSAQRIGHSYHIGLAYLHLARYSLFHEDWHQVLSYCQKSKKIFEEIGVTEHRIYGEVYAGQAWLRLGNLAEARLAARNALKFFQTPDGSGLSEERAHVLRLWSQVELAQGGKLGSAIEGLRKSIHLFGSLGNQVEQARSQVILSGVMLASGDSATAQSLLDDARDVFQRLGARIDLDRLPVI
jgi:predicted ATPase/class 3 adenylate cyclase